MDFNSEFILFLKQFQKTCSKSSNTNRKKCTKNQKFFYPVKSIDKKLIRKYLVARNTPSTQTPPTICGPDELFWRLKITLTCHRNFSSCAMQHSWKWLVKKAQKVLCIYFGDVKYPKFTMVITEKYNVFKTSDFSIF